jgi:multiple sugar transport system permease protein
MSGQTADRLTIIAAKVRRNAWFSAIFRRVGLAIFAIWCLFPIYWLVATSLKSPLEVMSRKPSVFFFDVHFANYAEVIAGAEIWSYFLNSTIVALGSTVLTLAAGIPTAYVLARYKFKGSSDFAFWILTTRMSPPVAVLIPFFVMYTWLGINDTHFGVIIAHVAVNISIVVWLLRSFFDDLPYALEEAAFMDGATYYQAFQHIALPLAMPGIAAVGILSFLFSWNEFLFALVLADDNVRTVPVGIYGFVGFQSIAWGKLSASATIMIVPVVVFLMIFQRSLVRGLTLGAVK